MIPLRVQPGDWQYFTGQGILFFLLLIYPSEARKILQYSPVSPLILLSPVSPNSLIHRLSLLER